MALAPAEGWTIGRIAGLFVPVLTIALAALVMMLPIAPRIGAYSFMPALTLAVLFIWLIERPDHLPPFAVLAVGLFVDLAQGGAVGLSAFVYLLLSSALMTQRYSIAALPERGLWTAFSLFVAASVLLTYVVALLYYGRFVSPLPLLAEGFMTAAVFPLVRAALRPLTNVLGGAG